MGLWLHLCENTHKIEENVVHYQKKSYNLVQMLPLMPNSFHIDLFQLAPSQLMWSASRPAFSQRMVASTMIFANVSALTLLRVAKTPST